MEKYNLCCEGACTCNHEIAEVMEDFLKKYQNSYEYECAKNLVENYMKIKEREKNHESYMKMKERGHNHAPLVPSICDHSVYHCKNCGKYSFKKLRTEFEKRGVFIKCTSENKNGKKRSKDERGEESNIWHVSENN